MEESSGRKLHKEASIAREKGDFLKALQLSDEALIAYQSDKDYSGFAEILAERALNLRHLAQTLEDNNFLSTAKGEMSASVEVARSLNSDEALVQPLFNLAKVLEDLGENENAVQSYRETVSKGEITLSKTKPAALADIKLHLAVCEFKNGNRSSLERAEQALLDLQNAQSQSDYDHKDSSYNDLDFYPSSESYNLKVWVSGAHMKLAEILREVDLEKAKHHLEEAKKVLDTDERLILRFKQWQKLAAKFS